MAADNNDNLTAKAIAGRTAEHFVQLDGLRGFAIILVVFCHCQILIHGGGIANAFFFALAGFLIINPFKERSEERFLSLWGILRFYGSRAVRILPGYYLVVLLVYFQSGDYWLSREQFIGLLYFNELWGHLWFVFSYFWVTVFIPYIMLLLLLLAKKIKALNNDLVCSVIFFVLGGIIRILCLREDATDFRLSQLMVGIGAGYLCRYIRNNERFKTSIIKLKTAGDVLILFIVLIMFIFSSEKGLNLIHPGFGDTSLGWDYMYISAFMMGLLIILTCLFKEGIAAKIFRIKPLVFVGKLSYPIYLLNYLIALQVRPKSEFFWFICVFSASLVLAYLMDSAFNAVIRLCKKKVKA